MQHAEQLSDVTQPVVTYTISVTNASKTRKATAAGEGTIVSAGMLFGFRFVIQKSPLQQVTYRPETNEHAPDSKPGTGSI